MAMQSPFIDKATKDALKAEFLLAAHPVGCSYESEVATSPATLFGGVWAVTCVGRVSVGINPNDTDFNAAGKTGGHKAMQQHTHVQNAHTHIQDAHSHVQARGYTDAIGYGTNYYVGVQGGNNYGSISTGSTTATNQNTTAVNQNTGTGNAGNLMPYETKYKWKRIA